MAVNLFTLWKNILHMKKNEETMKIVFEGQTSQIDANTLINFLIHYNTVVDAANKELGDGTKKIAVKINAIEKGSFAIDIELVEGVLIAMFSTETMSYLANLAEVIGGVFFMHKVFKGKPANNDEALSSMEIKKSGNAVIINNSTINIYNTPVVREAISKSLETVDQDQAIDGLRIDSKRGNAVTIEKEEFKNLIYDDFSSEQLTPDEKIVIDDNAMLGIIKMSFEKGAQWGFMYNGFRIRFTVKDDDLMNHIDDGARFAKGDHIRVKLEILQKYNHEFNVYENSSYKILEFKEHLENPRQKTLFE